MPYALAQFGLGEVRITRKAKESLARSDVLQALRRHQSGDWGESSRGDWECNDEALSQRKPLVSFYRSEGRTPFLIVTEANRSETVIHLSGQY